MKKIVVVSMLMLESCTGVPQPEQAIPYTLSKAELSTVQDGTRKFLKDPASATFENIRASQKTSGIYVCGVVNSKNGAGHFTGGEPFAGVLTTTSVGGKAKPSFALTTQGNVQNDLASVCRQNGIVS
ncbi:hypothetical protein ATY81_00925 [Rhizobium sp. R72]|uniref:hypothetical protein n=1 Tax=unclassified Rhizobium TaxID=2613769 RepID=UPI000B52AD37|nr:MULTISPECIES: hypothetical protein [unclassified Rhizobium]OWW04585.1 hypothetical protein ATY81_00925 [Rhizobium sp. R72]OWW05642.1 hypothetical protein ATY80_00925 [Rhizobium sp. R711]